MITVAHSVKYRVMTAHQYLTGGQFINLKVSSDITLRATYISSYCTITTTWCVVTVYSVSLASFMSTGELCVNPLAVISDNSITPVDEFDLAPIRTQIPGQKRRAG